MHARRNNNKKLQILLISTKFVVLFSRIFFWLAVFICWARLAVNSAKTLPLPFTTERRMGGIE